MKILNKVLIAAVAFTGLSTFASAANETPGLQFAIQPGTGDFVQFQSGPIYAGKDTSIHFDALRLAVPANPDCPRFRDLEKVTAYVMSGNSGKYTPFPLNDLDPPSKSYVKVGEFKTPQCLHGSQELQIWFVGSSGGDKCYDSAFGRNYRFPVICQ